MDDLRPNRSCLNRGGSQSSAVRGIGEGDRAQQAEGCAHRSGQGACVCEQVSRWKGLSRRAGAGVSSWPRCEHRSSRLSTCCA
eukprot:1157781-Pelagomonas_calceolata.AAC.6